MKNKTKSFKNTLFGIVSACITGLITTPGLAAEQDFMQVTGVTSTPIGHVRFCQANPKECNITSDRAPLVRLTDATWRELVAVNEYVNQSVAPVTDQDLYKVPEYWTFPTRYGDCEDYALQKRRVLMQRGWPSGALLVTVVVEPNNSGHAVLTVRTDKGDFILDNQDYRVRPWQKTSYRYIKRQSPRNSGVWTSILDQRPEILAQASTNNK